MPETGYALQTSFEILCSDWVDLASDYPLEYSFAVEGREGSAVSLSSSFQQRQWLPINFLPAGDVASNYSHNITVKIRDQLFCETQVTLQVQVLPTPSLVNADALEIAKAVAQKVESLNITSLMSNDVDRFVQEAGSLLLSLNDKTIPSSDLSQSESVQSGEIRASIRDKVAQMLLEMAPKRAESFDVSTAVFGNGLFCEFETDRLCSGDRPRFD